GPPEAFEVVPVHLARGGPTFGAAQDDDRPARPKGLTGPPRLFLDFADFQNAMLQGRSHRLVHALVIAAFHKIRSVPITDEQRLQLVVADTRQDCGVVDLVAIQMQDRQHRPVDDRVEEFVAVPAGGEGPRLGLAVANHHEGDQVRVVVGRPVSVRDAVAQFAAFVDTAGGFWRGVAADAAREGKLLEKALQPRCVFALFRVDLGVRPLEVSLGQYGGRPVPGATDVDRVEVVFFDQPVEVGVGKALTGVRTPMAQQPRLYMLQGQRLSQQGVDLEVQHTEAEIETRTPVRVDPAQLVGTERLPLDRRACRAVGRDGAVRAKRLVGGGARHPDVPHPGGRRVVLSYVDSGFSSAIGPERPSVRTNSAATERGATRYCVPGTGGAAAASMMSSGDSSEVSIHRRQPATASAGVSGRSKSSASQ